jgi:hypothetical protein
MNLFVIIDSKDQDETLGMLVDSSMKRSNWIAIPGFPYVYTKEEKINTPDYLTTMVRHDIGMAVDQAGWSQVRYLYTISENRPQLETTR